MDTSSCDTKAGVGEHSKARLPWLAVFLCHYGDDSSGRELCTARHEPATGLKSHRAGGGFVGGKSRQRFNRGYPCVSLFHHNKFPSEARLKRSPGLRATTLYPSLPPSFATPRSETP